MRVCVSGGGGVGGGGCAEKIQYKRSVSSVEERCPIDMVDVTIIGNLLPDRASFDHFCSTLRKRKKCVSQFFDQSSSNFGSLKTNKLSNY